AGPNCPGRGWNCTRSTRVLQIATDGGQNVVQCYGGTAGPPGSGSCVIDQHGTFNTAACVERSKVTDAAQSCMVTQAGARNFAVVFQGITTKKGSAQTGSQTASVIQMPAPGGTAASNDLALVQSVEQVAGGNGNDDNNDEGDDDEGATPAGPQSQDAAQSATVNQTAAGSGNN